MYKKLTLEQIEAAIEMLGGVGGVERLLNGGFEISYKVWKTVVIGTGCTNSSDFRTAIQREGYYVASSSDVDILNGDFIDPRTAKEEIDLVLLSTKELGLKEGKHTYADVFKRARELGLALCPGEVGPQLRLQYPDQRPVSRIRIGMEPVPLDGSVVVFEVRSDFHGRSLAVTNAHPDDPIELEHSPTTVKFQQWVLCRERNSTEVRVE